MPKEVEEAFFKWTLDGQDRGIKDCPVDFYEKESRAAYALFADDKAKLDYLERFTLSTIIESAQESAKAVELIERKWAEPQFREKVIIRSMMAGYRSEAGCRNANLPLKEILRDVMREY